MALADDLASIAPIPVGRTVFANCGAGAVDSAIKPAWHYHGFTYSGHPVAAAVARENPAKPTSKDHTLFRAACDAAMTDHTISG